MANTNKTEYRIGTLKNTCYQYTLGYRYIAYTKTGEHTQFGAMFKTKKGVSAFLNKNPNYVCNFPMKGLYEKLAPIQKLAWKDDDIIEYETMAEIYNKLIPLTSDTKYGNRIKELLPMFEDDCMAWDELMEAQDKLANIVLDVAYDERKDDRLIKDFPYIYHTVK